VTVLDRLQHATVTRRRKLTPDDAGVFRLASNIGYGLPESIADLIDNSIDAGASSVLIRIYQEGERLTHLAVADDGHGMDNDVLIEAMRIGTTTAHVTGLGKYGIGLKAASLSHTNTLTVVTRHGGVPAAVRYTPAGIREGWKLDVLDDETAEAALSDAWGPHVDLSVSGTIVVWEHMTKFAAAAGDPTRRFGQIARRLSQHLGLHFQRFLDRSLAIYIDLQVEGSEQQGLTRMVQPLDPFPPTSGHSGYPTDFQLAIGHGAHLPLRAFIWPPNSNDRGYKLGGQAAHRQGFYFYRNDRLIQAGGWNGWRHNDAEPHRSLARARIELPGDDTAFGLNAQKNGIVPPPGFDDALEAARAGTTTLRDYVRQAEETYRAGARSHGTAPDIVVPGSGLSSRVRRGVVRAIGASDNGAREVAMRWKSLPPDRFFELDIDAGEILLNQTYRAKVLNGARASAADAPLLKTLLFLLLEEDLTRQRMTRRMRERCERLNEAVLAALQQS
jgi:hypothetical protein